jgi:hypothetical protein
MRMVRLLDVTAASLPCSDRQTTTLRPGRSGSRPQPRGNCFDVRLPARIPNERPPDREPM